jgi:hypothetical protein
MAELGAGLQHHKAQPSTLEVPGHGQAGLTATHDDRVEQPIGRS